MKKGFYIYNPETGKIVTAGRASQETVLANVKPGFLAVTGLSADPNPVAQFHNVVTGKLEDRPAIGIPSALSGRVGESVMFRGIPTASVIYIDDAEVGVMDAGDGVLELVFNLDGKYFVNIAPPWPYIEATAEITVII